MIFLLVGMVLFGYSERAARRKAEGFGKRHAKRGVEHSPDLIVQRLIKSEPVIDPHHDPLLQQWHEEREPHPQCATWSAALEKAEQELTRFSNRWTLRAIFTLLLLVEFTAVSTLLKGQGIENPERAIVSAAGACLLFFLFYKATEN